MVICSKPGKQFVLHFQPCFNSTAAPRFTNLIHSMILERMAAFGSRQESWLWLCLLPDTEFMSKTKILPNASVCGSNCLPTKAFINWGTGTVFFSSHLNLELLCIVSSELLVGILVEITSSLQVYEKTTDILYQGSPSEPQSARCVASKWAEPHRYLGRLLIAHTSWALPPLDQWRR